MALLRTVSEGCYCEVSFASSLCAVRTIIETSHVGITKKSLLDVHCVCVCVCSLPHSVSVVVSGGGIVLLPLLVCI